MVTIKSALAVLSCWLMVCAPFNALGSVATAETTNMQCLIAVIKQSPLVLHFSLFNPPDAKASTWVPRSLEPFGAFVKVEIRDAGNAIVYASQAPKWTPKLHPDRAESYLELAPGYSHGVLLELPSERALPAGNLTLRATYSNLQYRGFAGHPIGEQACHVSISIRAP